MLNYKHLYYFWVVATEGSIKSACTRLNVTQPTISDQLRALERSLGVSLFDRNSRKMVLNEYGRLALKYANYIFRSGDELKKALSSKSVETVHVIRVGIIPSVSKSLCYQILRPLLDDRRFLLKVREESSNHLLNELETNSVDLILSDKSFKEFKTEMSAVQIFERTFFAVCSDSTFQNLKNKKFPKCLEEYPFINYTDDSMLHRQINRFFQNENLKIQIDNEIEDVNLILEAVIDGSSIAILPKQIVDRSVKRGELKILGEPENIHSYLYAVTKNPSSLLTELSQHNNIQSAISSYINKDTLSNKKAISKFEM